jgi:hypothetical protein
MTSVGYDKRAHLAAMFGRRRVHQSGTPTTAPSAFCDPNHPFTGSRKFSVSFLEWTTRFASLTRRVRRCKTREPAVKAFSASQHEPVMECHRKNVVVGGDVWRVKSFDFISSNIRLILSPSSRVPDSSKHTRYQRIPVIDVLLFSF